MFFINSKEFLVKIKWVLILCILVGCSNAQEDKLPFENSSLTFEKRVDDLVSRLTLKEKVDQMKDVAPAIPHLGIPAYNWWNETLHGVARSKDTVTVFPQAIALAAGFDRQAVLNMGEICATEARAIYNQALRDGENDQRYKGLTFWTPNINIFRDPRWGRGQETYGEDPFLTGQLGMAIVKGLQGDDTKYMKTSACAKHFAVHSGPESTRHTFDVDVSEYDLWNTYLPAFEDLVVDAKVSSVMCAYNRYQGTPCCGDKKLMVDILRNKWGFTGYVTSDCGAITDFWKTHKTSEDEMHASADAVEMGTDLECGEFWDKHWTYDSLGEAVKNDLIDEEKLNESVKRLFMTRMRLGMFDKNESVLFNDIPYSILNDPEHAAHALKMARQSMVLLKNNGVLPLQKNSKTIAVVGPNADNKSMLLGNYNGIPNEIITALAGIKQKLGDNVEVIYDQGVDYTKLLEGKSIASVSQKVKNADVIVFVGGISPSLEGEEGEAGGQEGFYKGDRTTIALPKVQTEMMKALKLTGKPLVYINMSGSAMGMEWEAENADAIIQAWYGGQSAGTAIADVLFGDYNPSGRLPITFYKNDADLPDFSDYSMENRTYRYFKGEAQFAFGFGLSYTTFNYSKLNVPKTISTKKPFTVQVEVENTGEMAGDEVVQIYVSKVGNSEEKAIRTLKEFKRIHLMAGEKKVVSIALNAIDLGGYTEQGEKYTAPGKYVISVGGGQPSELTGFTGKSVQIIVAVD